jgi:rubrerythrin
MGEDMMRDRLTRRSTRKERRSAPARRRDPEQGLVDGRRMRDSGGPEDRAQYACSCGYMWEAEVSTSVRCPHCGTPQAW